jgi:hypothetical protein
MLDSAPFSSPWSPLFSPPVASLSITPADPAFGMEPAPFQCGDDVRTTGASSYLKFPLAAEWPALGPLDNHPFPLSTAVDQEPSSLAPPWLASSYGAVGSLHQALQAMQPATNSSAFSYGHLPAPPTPYAALTQAPFNVPPKMHAAPESFHYPGPRACPDPYTQGSRTRQHNNSGHCKQTKAPPSAKDQGILGPSEADFAVPHLQMYELGGPGMPEVLVVCKPPFNYNPIQEATRLANADALRR